MTANISFPKVFPSPGPGAGAIPSPSTRFARGIGKPGASNLPRDPDIQLPGRRAPKEDYLPGRPVSPNIIDPRPRTPTYGYVGAAIYDFA